MNSTQLTPDGQKGPTVRTDPQVPIDHQRSLLVDRHEAARLLGVSPGTIDNLRTRGELPSIKIGARRLYDISDLHKYINTRKEVQE